MCTLNYENGKRKMIEIRKKRVNAMTQILNLEDVGRGELKTVSLCHDEERGRRQLALFGHFGYGIYIAEMSNLRGFLETSHHSPHFSPLRCMSRNKVERR